MELEILHNMGSDDIYDIIKNKAIADLKQDLRLEEDADINIQDHGDKCLHYLWNRCEEYVLKLHAAKAKHYGRSGMSEFDIDVKNLMREFMWELGIEEEETSWYPNKDSDDLPF